MSGYRLHMGGPGRMIDRLPPDERILGRVIFLTQLRRDGTRGPGVAVHEVASGIASDLHGDQPTPPGMYEARAAVHLKAACRRGLIEQVPGSRATRLRYWSTPAGDAWLREQGIHRDLPGGDGMPGFDPGMPESRNPGEYDFEGEAVEMDERELPAPRRQLNPPEAP